MVDSTGINPMIAVKAGIDASQSMTENYRKAQAYNALAQMYGPQVGNMDWGQAQTAYGAQQKLPGELEAQTLTNQDKRQTNAFNEINNPIKLEQNRANVDSTRSSTDYTRSSTDYNNQTMDSRVQQSQNTARKGTLDNRKAAIGLNDDQSERERNAAQGIIAAIKPRIAAGEDPAKVFDEVAPQISAHENVDPGQMQALKQQFVQNPAGTIQAIEDSLAAVRPATAAQRNVNAAAKLDLERRRVELAEKKANPPTSEAGVAATLGQFEHLDRTFNDLIGTDENPGLTDKVSRNTMLRTGANVIEKMTGGGVDADNVAYIKNLQSLTSAFGLDALQRLKATGASLGSVTEGEHKLLQDSVARLQSTRDPQEIKRELVIMRRAYERYKTALTRDLEKKPGGAAALEKVQGAPEADTDARRKALLDKYR
jgi:hypothetical protein